MTPQGAGYLFECLSFNESLRYLDVSSYEGSYRNKLGSKGAEYLETSIALRLISLLNTSRLQEIILVMKELSFLVTEL